MKEEKKAIKTKSPSMGNYNRDIYGLVFMQLTIDLVNLMVFVFTLKLVSFRKGTVHIKNKNTGFIRGWASGRVHE